MVAPHEQPQEQPQEQQQAQALRGARARARRRAWVAWLFLAPALIVLLVFTLYPIACGVGLAFCDYSMLRHNEAGQLCWPQWCGLDNFTRLWHDRYFFLALKNSLVYLLVVPVLQFLSILVALCLTQQTILNRMWRTALYLPVVTSVVVVGIAWKWALRSDGLINQVLGWLSGGTIAPIGWLTDSRLALYSVMFVTLWQGIGYYMILYLAGLQAISPEYEEAARLEGARSWQVLLFITMPLLKPTIALCTLLSSISALKVFSEVYIMTAGGPQNSTLVAVYYLYTRAFENFEMGYSASLSLVLAGVLALVSWANYRIFRDGGISSYY